MIHGSFPQYNQSAFISFISVISGKVFWFAALLRCAPADSGIAFAALWQGRLDTKDTHGNITLDIDIDVSNFADPSGAYVTQIAGASGNTG